MEYKITIRNFDSGLNELLNGVYFNWKIKKLVNPVKEKNDTLIMRQLRTNYQGLKPKIPLEFHYTFYCKDKRRDKMNVASAFIKSFEDSAQKVGMLKNDGWAEVGAIFLDWQVDANNPRVEIRLVELADSRENEAKMENLSTKRKTLSER